MSLLGTREKIDSWGNQLSLNFSNTASSASKARVADRIHAITSNNTTFYPEQSEIGDNNFSLKLSYMGRSYSVKWVYRKEQIRSFDQEDFSDTAIRIIRFDSILAFRDGRYVSAFLPKKEYDQLTENAYKILSNAHYNRTIH